MARKRARDTKPEAATGGDAPLGGVRATPGQVGGDAPRIPGWLPVAVFTALTLWLFRDFVFSDRMLFGGDTLSLGYVAREFYAEALKQMGTFPLWSPRILGGTPFLEALSGGDSLYPPSALLLLIMEPYRALGWKLVLHVLAAGFFMFGWTRSLGVSRAAALVAGVGYMLAPFLVTLVHPGHDGKLFVTALAPLLFWAVERHFVKPGPATFAGIGLVVALVLFTTHFQMAYFLFGAVGMYAIFRAVQTARGEGGEGDAAAATDAPGAAARPRWTSAGARFGLFLAASVVGAAGAGVQFLPSAAYVTEYSRRIQTTREAAGETGRDWSSSWSLHPEEAMSQLIPEFAGNNAGGSAWTNGTYWGRNATRDNMPTAGVLVLLLAAVSFAGGARRGLRYFMTGLGLVALLFALGTHTPVWGLFYALVPGIKLFRAPDMVMFLFVFATGTLAALGFDRIVGAVRDGDDAGWRGPLKVLAGGVGLLGFLWVLVVSGALQSLWISVIYPEISPGQEQLLTQVSPFIARGAFVATALAALLAGLVWLARRGTLTATAVLSGTLLLVAVDQLRVDASFVQTLDFHEWSRPDPNLQALLDREQGSSEPYRLLSFARSGQDVRPAMFGIELAAGHHPNDLSRYRELIGMVGSGFPDNLVNPNVRRLLNVRYILWPDWQLGPVGDQGVIARTTQQGGEPYETLLADAGLARARLVAAATVKSDQEAVPYMLSEAFDPAAEVVLAEAPPVALGGGPVAGEVRWEERSPNRLRLAVTSDRPALLVVADNWFPAWKATVDGADAPVLRAYHTLRAVPVPAGASTVEMSYRSATLTRSLWLSVLALGALLGLGGWGLAAQRRRAS
ncbi:MAG TPA: hypothetical protein VLH75_13940 [Longimicrobiales bacterium]|nr:hypothetical protein [Longimicrobiales bacterium]